MDAMTILKRCREAPKDLETLEIRIRQRRDALTQVSAAADQGGGRGTPGDRMAAVVAAIADIEQQATERRQRLSVEVAAACVLLDMLDERYSRVLHLYYVKGLTVRLAAKKMKYSEGYLRRLKREAEDAARAIPEDEVRQSAPEWYR